MMSGFVGEDWGRALLSGLFPAASADAIMWIPFHFFKAGPGPLRGCLRSETPPPESTPAFWGLDARRSLGRVLSRCVVAQIAGASCDNALSWRVSCRYSTAQLCETEADRPEILELEGTRICETALSMCIHYR